MAVCRMSSKAFQLPGARYISSLDCTLFCIVLVSACLSTVPSVGPGVGSSDCRSNAGWNTVCGAMHVAVPSSAGKLACYTWEWPIVAACDAVSVTAVRPSDRRHIPALLRDAQHSLHLFHIRRVPPNRVRLRVCIVGFAHARLTSVTNGK